MSWCEYIEGFQFLAVTYPSNKADGIVIEDFQMEKLIQYIQKRNISKAYIKGVSDYEFILQCPSVEHLFVEFRIPFSKWDKLVKRGARYYIEYDLSDLYNKKNLKSITLSENESEDIYAKCSLDISKIKGLEMYWGSYNYIMNIGFAEDLKTLVIDKYTKENLKELEQLKKLDTLKLSFSKIRSLKGLEELQGMQCLYLEYNRLLQDVSALQAIKDTLKVLRIDHCPNVQDFSVIENLENLEVLQLFGNNKVLDLKFLGKLKKLKTFIFDINVLDGDLSPVLSIPHVCTVKNRRHYNFKDEDLPKTDGEIIYGNENIEEWRRIW